MKRIRDFVKKDKKFGLIGHPLSHSLSPIIHRDIMKQCKINGSYELFDITAKDFKKKALELIETLDGFNITIPYKEKFSVITNSNYESAKITGAVNTVFEKKGYNTDISGFDFYNIDFKNKRVCLLGAGGVSRIMLFKALKGGSSEICICARRKDQAAKLAEDFLPDFPGAKITVSDFNGPDGAFDIILNGTPLGMWPKCNAIPIKDEIIKKAEYVFDSIYNPPSTRLLLKARSFGIKAESGLEMLVLQALEAQKIWNPGRSFVPFNPENIIPLLKNQLLKNFPVKYVLTGFMGSGKSTTGKKLAHELGIEFADLDLIVVEECKMSIPRIFKIKGEKYFREKERYCLEKLMKQKGSLVISTGGGALINPENVRTVKEKQGFIVYLEIALDEALKRLGDKNERPLLQGKAKEDIEKLYYSRIPIYENISDYKQNALEKPDKIVTEIESALGL